MLRKSDFQNIIIRKDPKDRHPCYKLLANRDLQAV